MDRTDLIAYPEDRVRFFRDSGFWRDETLTDWLARHAEARPDHPAIVHGEARLTYGELALHAERLAAGLAGIGLGRGDVVALQLPNIP
ncbi:MAG: AMP-binding protein [Alphaproteobacteria bacterium]|nr:AMP-binding protein [Alphaproteobacteria bacterium]